MLVWFRKKFYECFSSESACDRRVKRLLNLKVQSPFDKNDVITLGDIIFTTAMTEKEILDIAKSYGIDLPSKAIDVTPDKSLEYLLYHGKNFQYTFTNSAGEKVVAGIEQIGDGQYIRNIPLIPDTHLDRIIELYKASQEGLGSFYGHVAEFGVRDALTNQGYQVFIPSASNTPGYDLCVEKRFFDNYGLDYVENPDIPGYGLLQVKSTIGNNVVDYTSNTLEHFNKYHDIPVVASDRIVRRMEGTLAEGKLISFGDVGVEEDLETGELLPETFIVNTGLESTHFAGTLNNSVDALTLSDFTAGTLLEHLHIPTVGIAIAAGISSYKQYRMVKDNQISLAKASVNIAKDTSKAAIISTTTIGLTSLTAGAIGISATESANGIAEWAFGDAELDFSDVGEFGFYVAIAAGIGGGVKKLWNWIVGDPFEQLKRLNTQRVEVLNGICQDIEMNKAIFVERLTPPKDYVLQNNLLVEIGQLDSRNNKLIENYRSKIKPLSYYVIKEKIDLLKTVLQKIEDEYVIKRKAVEDYIDRILMLADLARHCNEKNVSKTKRNFFKMYRKELNVVEESNIRKKLDSKDQLISFLYNVLNSECQKLLEMIEKHEETFKTYRRRLVSCNAEIQEEISRLRAQGKL